MQSVVFMTSETYVYYYLLTQLSPVCENDDIQSPMARTFSSTESNHSLISTNQIIEVPDAFFCPQIAQMDTNFFSDRFFSDCTDCWSLDGSCHAGCFVHQSSPLATTIIRAIRENL